MLCRIYRGRRERDREMERGDSRVPTDEWSEGPVRVLMSLSHFLYNFHVTKNHGIFI